MGIIKQLIKQILRHLGIGVYNLKNARRHNMSEALDHLIAVSVSPKTVIDVGVAYGTYDLYKKFPQAVHLLVEPLKEYKGVLEKISKEYNVQYELAAAGATHGTVEINVHPDLSGSSIFEETEEGDVNGVLRTVPMVTLDELCAHRNLEGPFLIKLDTQGSELSVLEGARKVLSETDVIIMEVSLFELYRTAPQFYDVVQWMKKHGFVTYDMFGGQNRPLDNALAQVDLVFVKEDSFLRQHHFYATPEQRRKHTQRVQLENPKCSINS